MRYWYVVSYDISDQKRWRRIYRKMRGYGTHTQLSVFLCELSHKELAIMKNVLGELIKHDEDSVMIVKVGRSDSNPEGKIHFLGKQSPIPERQAVII